MLIRSSTRKTLLLPTLKTLARAVPLLAAKKLDSHKTGSSFMDKIKMRSRKTSTKLSSKTTRELNSSISRYGFNKLLLFVLVLRGSSGWKSINRVNIASAAKIVLAAECLGESCTTNERKNSPEKQERPNECCCCSSSDSAVKNF